ncbi:MAG TPA: hypothetical protein VK809_04365 [Bacteroidia bacterium]|jgi:hypothetical protein|nr:hypothetical protein [Bacteroidia bacterium]
MRTILFFLIIALSLPIKAQQITNRQIDSIYKIGKENFDNNNWENALQNLYIARFLYQNLYNPPKGENKLRPIDIAINQILSELRQAQAEHIIVRDTAAAPH